MERRFCDALAALWQRRRLSPISVGEIVDYALKVGEEWAETRSTHPVDEPVWYARLVPDTLQILEINPAGCAYLGFPPAFLHHRPVTDFINAANAPLVRDVVAQAAATGEESGAFLRDRNGKFLIFTAHPVYRDGALEIQVFARPAHMRLWQYEPRLVGEA